MQKALIVGGIKKYYSTLKIKNLKMRINKKSSFAIWNFRFFNKNLWMWLTCGSVVTFLPWSGTRYVISFRPSMGRYTIFIWYPFHPWVRETGLYRFWAHVCGRTVSYGSPVDMVVPQTNRATLSRALGIFLIECTLGCIRSRHDSKVPRPRPGVPLA